MRALPAAGFGLAPLILALTPQPAAPTSAAALGPPAICFPIDIGDARSLPWGVDGAFDGARDYDRERVLPDALAILRASDDALVHMETLRRAALYLTGLGQSEERRPALWRQAHAERLVSALRQRVLDAELPGGAAEVASSNARGLAWFDLGYAIGALQQSGMRALEDAPQAMARALRLRGDDGALCLGAALAGWMHDTEATRWDRLECALDAAAPGSLLQRNLMQTAGLVLGAADDDELAHQIRRRGA